MILVNFKNQIFETFCILLLANSVLIAQNENCTIDLKKEIDLKSFRAKSIELHEHFNLSNFYEELRKCNLISDFDSRVMHDADLGQNLRNNVYDKSIDSITTYEDLLFQFNLQMKTDAFKIKRKEILIFDKLLEEITQTQINLNNWKSDSLKLIKLGIDETELPYWKEHIKNENLEGQLYKYFFENK